MPRGPRSSAAARPAAKPLPPPMSGRPAPACRSWALRVTRNAGPDSPSTNASSTRMARRFPQRPVNPSEKRACETDMANPERPDRPVRRSPGRNRPAANPLAPVRPPRSQLVREGRGRPSLSSSVASERGPRPVTETSCLGTVRQVGHVAGFRRTRESESHWPSQPQHRAHPPARPPSHVVAIEVEVLRRRPPSHHLLGSRSGSARVPPAEALVAVDV